LGEGYPYLCHNTGRNVVLAQEFGSEETWEAFADELLCVCPLEAMATL
jgi:hypothetical protein